MSHKRSSKIVTPKDEWQTPQWLFDLLNEEFRFEVDAAALKKNAKCDHYYDPLNDALCGDWYENAKELGIPPVFFLNPDYSAVMIAAFMKKAYEESQKGAVVVCLVPVSGDKWWIDYALKAQEIRYIRGRVKFVGYDEDGNQVNGSPMFSSCVVIFNRDLSRGYPIIGTTIEQPKRTKPEQQEQTVR
jgi:site-specific DNA-methyltransferase (adenine-specific)